MKNNHKREFTVLIERDQDNMLVATVGSLRGCHTQAKDMATLLKRVKEAITLCLEVEKDAPPPLKFVGVQEVFA